MGVVTEDDAGGGLLIEGEVVQAGAAGAGGTVSEETI